MHASMRWWLTGLFAMIAALTAIAGAEVARSRTDALIRQRAQDVVAGRALQAAIDLSDRPLTRANVDLVASKRGLALFLFDANGRLVSSRRSGRVALDSLASRQRAVEMALAGRRFVVTNNSLRATTVALPVRPSRGALLAYAYHPDFAVSRGIVRGELVKAAAVAIVIGGLIGLVVSLLVAARLRRISAAAAAIAAGDFDASIEPMWRDELGDLAATFDQMRARLKESFLWIDAERRKLRRTVERLREAVIAVDKSLIVEVANERARRLTEIEPLQVGQPLPEPWPDFPLRGFAASLFAPGAKVTTVRVVASEDQIYEATGLPPASGGDAAMLVVADISERDREERAQREFVSNAAHELRTPLTTIIGAVDALQSGAKEEPAERDRFMKHIERESRRLSRLIDSLLVLARAQSHHEAPASDTIDVRAMLEDVARSMRVRDGVRVEVDCPVNLKVACNVGLTEQALTNVATNAARHTREGTITLAARTSPEGDMTLVVRDTGSGIAACDRERIFERFFRANGRSDEGFGLGLSIARAAARAQGGDVKVEAAEEGGTVACITLPMQK